MAESAPPPNRDDGLVPEVISDQPKKVQIGPWAVSKAQAKRIFKISSSLGLLTFAGWLLQNFLQLRGVVDLVASRIDLAVMLVALLGVVWIATASLKRRGLIRILGVIILVLGVFGLDAWAPKPPGWRPCVVLATTKSQVTARLYMRGPAPPSGSPPSKLFPSVQELFYDWTLTLQPNTDVQDVVINDNCTGYSSLRRRS
jgi:hypothetical protein